ncbi:MAG TPA: cysteine dioxygenase family protein [Burkholderiaceae bacterium]|jgi:predicted metal-dependent enzyme (double-stranded beta helix superfamily)
MVSPALDKFIAASKACAARHAEPADCVAAIVPLMCELLEHADSFLAPQHLRADPMHYARNAIHVAPDRSLSLYALVWTPGQWTPVHDHGSWGVVGVCRGLLEERSYVRSGPIEADTGIALQRGGVILLGPGSVTSFVPNPDHIHLTGVSAERPQVVSLHLYGRNMDSFHLYDVDAGTRRRVNLEHNES